MLLEYGLPLTSKRADVIVVAGGPGSGKSVIALSVLGDLYRRGVPALHATGSQSATKTMRKVAGARKPEVQKLFRYFNSFMEAEPNDLDVLVCDEAHRLRKTSANRYTKAALRTGRPQVAELIDAARVPVFLLDQHQVVRPGEMGTVEQARPAAAEQGPDLVWRTDRWVVDRTASKDPSFTKATPDEDIDRLVRNTYKVLLTRGMIGTTIYSTDPETREKLRSLIPPAGQDPGQE